MNEGLFSLPSRFAMESHQERILEILLKSNKRFFICPLDNRAYADARTFFQHCRDKSREDSRHEIFASITKKGDFKTFIQQFSEAVGWEEITEEDLPLEIKPGRPRYSGCFETTFIIMAKTHPRGKLSKIDFLKTICDSSSIRYMCPKCVIGFSTGEQVLQHCAPFDDEIHQGLCSSQQGLFIECYEHALNTRIDKKETICIEYDSTGTPSGFAECFQLGEILKHITPKFG